MPLPRESPGAIVDGHFIPKGTVVSTAAWPATHSAVHFYAPYEFHPERWLPKSHEFYDKRFKDDAKEASKPFSSGSRACLGINLAYMEMRICLVVLVWHFDWELVSKELDLNRDAMMRMLWDKPELRVRFRPVNRS